MAKSKVRKKRKAGAHGARKIAWGGPPTKGTRYLNLIFGVAALGAVVAGGVYVWSNLNVKSSFLSYADQGRGRLDGVVTRGNLGRGHLAPGELQHYAAEFPTSGRHSLTWAPPGFHRQAQPPTLLVHALEHGNIVIYYDQPGPAVIDTLEDWAGLYGGQWDGLVAVPKPGLGERVVLTAWTRELRLARFDPALAAAFIDKYRGRGPENPVR
jgi:hypothetical protein